VESTEKQKEGSGGKKDIEKEEEIIGIIETIGTPVKKAAEAMRGDRDEAVVPSLLARDRETQAGVAVAVVIGTRVVGVNAEMRVTLVRAERMIGNAMTAIVVVNGAITRLLLGEIVIMITERRGVTEGIGMIIIREIRRQRNLPTRLIEIIQNKGEGKMLHMLGLP
jgi:hypothetical protein